MESALPSRKSNASSTVADGGSSTAPASGMKSDRDAASHGLLPALSLPKGGGAIRGIGEKFGVNPVTGTGSMTVPVFTSPGRAGMGPQLSLSYDSGAGNGPFGLGWNLSLPAITRKTDKGLPRYRDAEESDVFILSGAEDLVMVFKQDDAGNWVRDGEGNPVVKEEERDGHAVRFYRPRIEGLFARIERWTRSSDGDVHWRSISKDNLTTLYGKSNESRIRDPEDDKRIFSWLICESYDDKGNAVSYRYEIENSKEVKLSQAHEKNRSDAGRTANRYLKRIQYGNRVSRLIQPDLSQPKWMFEVVFDYGEHDAQVPTPDDAGPWRYRPDPFSSYRAGFEVRTYRRCERVLMFHRFDELGEAPTLVRSTDFTYRQGQPNGYSLLASVTQTSYVRKGNGYGAKSVPPLSFDYSTVPLHETTIETSVQELHDANLHGDSQVQLLDLDGEGLAGMLIEHTGAWYYRRNLSPLNIKTANGGPHLPLARFAPPEPVASRPATAEMRGVRRQFLDLTGNGRLDLAWFDEPLPGFFQRGNNGDWEPFRTFAALPKLDWNDPHLSFVDLTGDGFADLLITDDTVFTWYPSRGAEGFAPAQRIFQGLDEERAPRRVLGDATQAMFLADMSGDGLTDIVRIRAEEVCYWPNLGYGRFGAKVTMDNAPHLDTGGRFDQRRIHLADTDGSGTVDLIYLTADGPQVHFNLSGCGWSTRYTLTDFPPVDNMIAVQVTDLLAVGTACLVWSSPLPSEAHTPLRYVNLMAGGKPHLLRKVVNNLGTETRLHYAPSTQFYLTDQLAGKPWITNLHFPVHVVERVETYDRISRNYFVTRYAYHHGCYDEEEREFRGFAMVEQLDTEEFAVLDERGNPPASDNWEKSSHVPPVLTKTWFHTGVYPESERVSKQFAQEYYQEGDASLGEGRLTDRQLEAMLLPDTVLPGNLTAEEAREACRSLKGAVLRQEVYALDEREESDRPYSVSERNYSIRLFQPHGRNPHAVFFTHMREAIEFHYERKLYEIAGQKRADPRVTHSMTLETDDYGNVLRAVAIGYGRRFDDPALVPTDREKQKQTLLTYSENRYTKPILEPDDYRTPTPCEARTYELVNVEPEASQPGVTNLFRFDQLEGKIKDAGDGEHELLYEDVNHQGAITTAPYRRLIEHVRTLYRRDDFGGLLELGELKPRALPGESYQLAFTPGLIAGVFKRQRAGSPLENLMPDTVPVFGGAGGYVRSLDLKNQNLFPRAQDDEFWTTSDADDHWWIPSGRIFYHPDKAETPERELAFALEHFFLPHRSHDPFGQELVVIYDEPHKLLPVEARDALGNTSRAEYDYGVLSARRLTDPNGNRSEVVFDTLGMVAGTAVMGKTNAVGDSLVDFEPELTEAQLDAFIARPRQPSANPAQGEAAQLARDLLKNASTRIVYDLDRFHRLGEPPFAAVIAREQHVSDLLPGEQAILQISFSYSDGFGREIQKKIQAEPGPLVENGPLVNPRWVGSGWTIFNNKGQPVRQYEPFFSNSHRFEFAREVGVSSVLFYDPVERVVATLHPNKTYEKVLFDPWQQATWDANDTVLLEPKADPDVKEFFRRLPDNEYLPTWHRLRTDAALALAEWPDANPENRNIRAAEKAAAEKTAAHAATPTITHLDTLGRAFLTIADDGGANKFTTRLTLDIENNQRVVTDARGIAVMTSDFNLLGAPVHTKSPDAGQRWMLNDVTGKPLRAWNGLGHAFRFTYDPLRRSLARFVRGHDPAATNREILFEAMIYGDRHPQAAARNLMGKLFLQFDSAGTITTDDYDFKGNLLSGTRNLARDYKRRTDWSSVEALLGVPPPATLDLAAIEEAIAPLLEQNEKYTYSGRFDALNRRIETHAPDGSMSRPVFNEANLLNAVNVQLQGAGAFIPFVSNIDYNAKGQRELIVYGNGATTTYGYDLLTFRLTHLRTIRPAGVNGLAAQLFTTPVIVQDLLYTYDPTGNITSIRDAALRTIINNGEIVEPKSDYTYDALYRLTTAKGREHIGQTSNNRPEHRPELKPHYDFNDSTRIHPNDSQAMRNYTEAYEYDSVGNILQWTHSASGGSWTRAHLHAADSNRLLRTSLPGDNNFATYDYDAHGNLTRMQHLSSMRWDFEDQLAATSRQVRADGGTPEITYYVYDVGGQRVRKVTENEAAPGQTPSRKQERIYLGGYEIYREYNGAAIKLERDTLHVMDDKQRIALIETRTIANPDDNSPTQLIRYQLTNHLGTATLELDGQAQLISHEEYYPYGNTSYQAVRNQTETPKRYRFTGKERDEESGLYYHVARYYASWLGRWINPDPSSLIDGPNVYRYAGDNPIMLKDPSGMYGINDLNKDLGRVNRVMGVLIPQMGMVQAATSSITAPLTEAITGKTQKQEGEQVRSLSIPERVEAATESLIAVTPVAPIHRASKATGQAIGQAIKGTISKKQAGLRVAKLEPTGIVAKTSETVEAVERAQVAAKSGDRGAEIRADIDVGLSALETAQAVAILLLGMRAGGAKSKGPKPPTRSVAGELGGRDINAPRGTTTNPIPAEELVRHKVVTRGRKIPQEVQDKIHETMKREYGEDIKQGRDYQIAHDPAKPWILTPDGFVTKVFGQLRRLNQATSGKTRLLAESIREQNKSLPPEKQQFVRPAR